MSGIISARAWGKVWAYRSTFLLGLLNTVETAIFAILLALVLGVIFGLMATSGKKILQVISRVYVEIMQNTPILLQLCFFYYALAFSGHSIGILPTGIVALGVYTGAYMAEVVRAGIESIPKGQFEASDALGMKGAQKYIHVILPQAVRIMIPSMVTFLIALIKDSSLVSVIGYIDLTRAGRIVTNLTMQPFLTFIVVGIFYFILCYSLSIVSKKLEMRFNVHGR